MATMLHGQSIRVFYICHSFSRQSFFLQFNSTVICSVILSLSKITTNASFPLAAGHSHSSGLLASGLLTEVSLRYIGSKSQQTRFSHPQQSYRVSLFSIELRTFILKQNLDFHHCFFYLFSFKYLWLTCQGKNGDEGPGLSCCSIVCCCCSRYRVLPMSNQSNICYLRLCCMQDNGKTETRPARSPKANCSPPQCPGSALKVSELLRLAFPHTSFSQDQRGSGSKATITFIRAMWPPTKRSNMTGWMAVTFAGDFQWSIVDVSLQPDSQTREYCMDLVSLETQQENDYIQNWLESRNLTYTWTSGRYEGLQSFTINRYHHHLTSGFVILTAATGQI